MTGAIFLSDDRGRPCKRKDAYMWTFIGAEKWYYVSEFPIPWADGPAPSEE